VLSNAGGIAGGAFGYTALHLASFNLSAWDAGAAFASYPVVVKTSVQNTAANEFIVNRADISLDPAFLGGDDSTRVSFIAEDITDAAVTGPATQVGGIFRAKDTTIASLLAGTGMQSVSWNGTNLVAGPTLTNQIRRSADALTTSPTISSASSFKRPGTDGVSTNAVVAWAGVNVVGGTTGNGSAFAISTDNGATFTDTSLIDTTLAAIEGIQVATDGSQVYLLTNNGAQTSLWTKTDAWYNLERQQRCRSSCSYCSGQQSCHLHC